jgi:hypothetical protein
MVENISLGEAIGGGTNLSGNWDNPISKGMQLDAQNEFKKFEQEQAKQAALEKKQAEMKKLSTFDYNKWDSPEVAKKFENYVDTRLPEMEEKFKKGDKMGAMKVRSEIENEMMAMKFLDKSIGSLRKLPTTSPTKRGLEKDFNEGGVFKIIEEDNFYNNLPPRIENYDEITGSFNPVNIKNPNLNRQVERKAKARLSEITPTIPIGKQGNKIIYGIDPNSEQYKQAKQTAINEILEDDETFVGIQYTDEFRKYYKDYMKSEGLNAREDDEQDLIIAMERYVGKKFDENKVMPTDKQTPRSGSATDTNKFRFTTNADGSTSVAYGSGRTPAYATFAGEQIITKDGVPERRKITYEYKAPTIKYLGNGEFEINGFESDGGELVPIQYPLRVTKNELMFKLGLDEAKLKANFPAYAKEKSGAVQKPKSGVVTPKSGVTAKKTKDSYPAWKSKNPNGTPAQYKQYLKN